MIYNHDDDTIIAQCTPNGAGAIALIRISGAQAVAVADRICKLASRKELTACESHTVHFARVYDERGGVIDHVMVTLMRAPKTFTGQDTVEITSHNNQFIIEHIVQRALVCGARMAQAGEFTRRAVLNGKMDLLQAEALNELIHANTQQTLKQALAQLEGSFSSWIATIEYELVRARAFCEASFEFIDEEMTFDAQIKDGISRILATIVTIKRTFDAQQQIRQGVRIALIGSVNAGKSSLFNALVGTKRAIVTAQPGTTRDTIEAGLYRSGSYWTIVDTAGLRETDDQIEQEGIARSHAEAERADVVLIVVDGARAMTPAECDIYHELYTRYAHKAMVVYTKADMPQMVDGAVCEQSPVIMVSTVTNTNIVELEALITERVAGLLARAESPYLLNHRQYHVLLSLEQQLLQIEQQLTIEIAYELLSIHLNDALALVSEMTGKSVSEYTMDAVFRQFCVGK